MVLAISQGRYVHLLVEALHGELSSLSLSTACFGGLGGRQRFAVPRIEGCLRAQEARHQEVEQRPQLQHVVLDWGAAQYEPVMCRYALHSLQCGA